MGINITVKRNNKIKKDDLVAIIEADQVKDIKSILKEAFEASESEKIKIGLDWIYSIFNPLEE